ncbi:MAG: IS3 family transposase [Bacteroidales bacterium]|nr:IS3 family transposase [Bacteroidales bacterium]
MRLRHERINMVDVKHPKLSIVEQCDLLEIHRSGLYYKPIPISAENLEIMKRLDKQYFKTPFYGVLRLTKLLKNEGFCVNKKRVRRLMKLMNWRTIYREPRTTISRKSDYKYPYLLKGLKIKHPNQVWSMDITYIPMKQGFMYLAAIIDIHSRYVVNWSLSNSMTSEWCAEVLEEAIAKEGKPQIFNTDQGSQFTSETFISVLKNNEIQISMDGKGRALDNIFIERLWKSVKYENVYLNVYETGLDLYKGLSEYFEFYNYERIHQSLDYETPSKIYKLAA